jgi:cellulose synthase (UDP-forming)
MPGAAASDALLPAASLGLAVLLFLTGGKPSQPHLRALVCATTAGVAACYMLWRFGQVSAFPREITAEAAWMWGFLGIETLCLINLIFTMAVWSRTTDRRQEADRAEARLRALPPSDHPAVDVWVATYDEDRAILERTLAGCLALDWPGERLKIHVLDDGRRDWLRDMCAAWGVGYIRRPDNRHRKAGNHNHALETTSAPVILSLDADFVPFANLLYRTVGLLDAPDVWAVQTPQVFYNVEPTRKNLGLHRVLPVTYDNFFYDLIQPARDAWGAAFYCGSAAVLRRSALVAAGGFETRTDIEDQATSVRMLSLGWRVRYLNEPLANGLAAESNKAYHDQRSRWCRGSLQILHMPYGPFGRGLGPMHRLLFLQQDWLLNALFPPLIATAPAAFLLFGWWLFPDAAPLETALMPPVVVASIWLCLGWISRGIWLPLVAPAFHLYTGVGYLPTAVTSLIKPFGKPLTRIMPVTAKGDAAHTGGMDRPRAMVLAGLLAANLLGLQHAIQDGSVLLAHAMPALAVLGWTLIVSIETALALRCCWEPRGPRAENGGPADGGAAWVHLRRSCRIRTAGEAPDRAAQIRAAQIRAAASHGVVVLLETREMPPLERDVLVILPGLGELPARIEATAPDESALRLGLTLKDPALHRRWLAEVYAKPDRAQTPRPYRLSPVMVRVVGRLIWS